MLDTTEMAQIVRKIETVTVALADLISMDDAARDLQIPISTLSMWMDKGVLPVYIKPHQTEMVRPQRFTSRRVVAERRLFLSGKNKGQLV